MFILWNCPRPDIVNATVVTRQIHCVMCIINIELTVVCWARRLYINISWAWQHWAVENEWFEWMHANHSRILTIFTARRLTSALWWQKTLKPLKSFGTNINLQMWCYETKQVCSVEGVTLHAMSSDVEIGTEIAEAFKRNVSHGWAQSMIRIWTASATDLYSQWCTCHCQSHFPMYCRTTQLSQCHLHFQHMTIKVLFHTHLHPNMNT